MRISDWSSDVCSSDLILPGLDLVLDLLHSIHARLYPLHRIIEFLLGDGYARMLIVCQVLADQQADFKRCHQDKHCDASRYCPHLDTLESRRRPEDCRGGTEACSTV